MAKARYKEFLEKSVQSAVSSIEIYNKPDFKYREETFSILMINAWELLLKAKILKDNNGRLNSIYIPDRKYTKNGDPVKRFYSKKNRSGNPMTLSITDAINKCDIEKVLRENLDLMIAIRDNSVHFINTTKEFEKVVLEIGTANLRSYLNLINKWFNYNLDKYNFFLMPITFFHSFEMDSFSINGSTQQQENFLAYVSKKMRDNPTDLKKPHNVALKLETRFERSASSEAFAVKYDKSSKFVVRQELTEKIKIGLKNGTLYSHDDLIAKLKQDIPGFRINKEFNDIKNDLRDDDRYVLKYPYNPLAEKGPARTYWKIEAVSHLKKHYEK